MRRTLSLTCSLVFIALLPVLALAQGNSNSSAKATAPRDAELRSALATNWRLCQLKDTGYQCHG